MVWWWAVLLVVSYCSYCTNLDALATVGTLSANLRSLVSRTRILMIHSQEKSHVSLREVELCDGRLKKKKAIFVGVIKSDYNTL